MKSSGRLLSTGQQPSPRSIPKWPHVFYLTLFVWTLSYLRIVLRIALDTVVVHFLRTMTYEFKSLRRSIPIGRAALRFAIAASVLLMLAPSGCSTQTLDPEDPLFVYRTPQLDEDRHYLYESFDDSGVYESVWTQSQAVKPKTKESKYDGEWILVNAHPKLVGKMLSYTAHVNLQPCSEGE